MKIKQKTKNWIVLITALLLFFSFYLFLALRLGKNVKGNVSQGTISMTSSFLERETRSIDEKVSSVIDYFSSNSLEDFPIFDFVEIEENKYIVDKMRKIVYLYIPSNTIFNDVDIDIKSGLIEIDNLNTKEFEIDNMSASIKINNLNVSSNFDIDNTSGTIDIENSNINNIDTNIKSGIININSLLTGNNHIELKSGTVNLNLKGDDYRFKTTKISGIISINEEMENVNSNGNTFIDIEVISGTVNVLTKW